MSIAALTRRLSTAVTADPVTSVTSNVTAHVTGKPFTDQHGNVGNTGNIENNREEGIRADVGIRYATPERLADDRRTCGECAELEGGACMAARRGELRHASKRLEPEVDRLHRCPGYRPGKSDQDQRPGVERWPGMARYGQG